MSTGQSQTDSTWTDGSVGCDTASNISTSSRSFFTTIILQRGQRNEFTNNQRFTDEEEGSYKPTAEASTASSIRSRFISSGNRHDTGTKSPGHTSKKRIAVQDKRKATNSSSKGKSDSREIKRDQHSYNTQELVKQHKGSVPQRIHAKEMMVEAKQYCDTASTAPSFAGSKTSMDEIDLNSLILE